MAAILGMGNPLLDISASADQALMTKYSLEAGGIVLAEPNQMGVFADLEAKADVKYIAGGATQNSIRVAQWMLQEAGSTAYMGCVGKDAYADKLQAACKAEGVDARYLVDDKTPTGTCACLIVDKERSLCTNLAAANNYKVEHVQQADNWTVVEKAKITYSAGFFITVSMPSMKAVSEETVKRGTTYCVNLSAPFICEVPPFRNFINEILPAVDFLFGNETEARAYAGSGGMEWGTADVEFIALRLSLVPMVNKGGKPCKRTVVFTQGSDDTIVAINGHVTRHPITKLNKDQIVDTNGAGDAFVGGFLAALSKGKAVAECCKAGNYSASTVIQQSGCTYPAKPNYTF